MEHSSLPQCTIQRKHNFVTETAGLIENKQAKKIYLARLDFGPIGLHNKISFTKEFRSGVNRQTANHHHIKTDTSKLL